MKNLTLLASLLLVCSAANSAPVSLNCISNADEDVEEVVIRFDQAANTFKLYGKSMWSVRTNNDEGGAAVKGVKFTDNTIVVKFKRRAALFVNVWAIAASGGRTSTLNRITGTWTLGKRVYQCTAFEGAEARQFYPVLANPTYRRRLNATAPPRAPGAEIHGFSSTFGSSTVIWTIR